MAKLSRIQAVMVMAAFLTVLASGIYGQITINLPSIPQIPKIKKTKPTPTPEPVEETSSPATTEATKPEPDSDAVASSAPATAKCTDDPVTSVFLEDIEKTRKQAAEYTPGLRNYYVQDFNDNENKYLKSALSPSERKDWLGKWDQRTKDCINPALDDLAAVARKTLPTYGPTYDVHNLAEEKIIRGAVSDLAKATVFRVALQSANWKIDKDDYNLPTARFKYGMIWAKYPGVDDGFCRIIYVNVVQDYSGGGTYNTSEGRFIKSEYAGCPPGK